MKISRKLKDIAFVAFEVICLVLVIGGIGWTDYAETKFWQAAWIVLAILGGLGFIGGIYWKSQQKESASDLQEMGIEDKK
jgi:hypothetical protein